MWAFCRSHYVWSLLGEVDYSKTRCSPSPHISTQKWVISGRSGYLDTPRSPQAAPGSPFTVNKHPGKSVTQVSPGLRTQWQHRTRQALELPTLEHAIQWPLAIDFLGTQVCLFLLTFYRGVRFVYQIAQTLGVQLGGFVHRYMPT